MPWGAFYTIGKVLKCKCRKWPRMTHSDICSTSHVRKKGRESNWQFDSRPLKVGNRPDSLAFRRRATYRWKAFNEGYNFALDLISIGGLHKKLCALKVTGVLAVAISGLPLRSPGTKSHLDMAPMEWCRVYYMGEGGGFPRVRTMVSLVSPKSPVARPNTKGALKSELTNSWLVGWMQVRVTKWRLSLVLVPIEEPQHAPLPLLVLRAGRVPRALNNSVVWPI